MWGGVAVEPGQVGPGQVGVERRWGCPAPACLLICKLEWIFVGTSGLVEASSSAEKLQVLSRLIAWFFFFFFFLVGIDWLAFISCVDDLVSSVVCSRMRKNGRNLKGV